MATIDLLIVVDANRVVQDHGKNNGQQSGHYVQLKQDGQGYVFMLGPWENDQPRDGHGGEGSDDPDISVKKGDTIRWRITSLSMGHLFQCFITHFSVNVGAQYITPPKPKHEVVSTPQIDSSAPDLNRTICRQLDDFYWESTVLETGHASYYIAFAICGDGCGGGCDCACCNCCGGYQWDPWIN